MADPAGAPSPPIVVVAQSVEVGSIVAIDVADTELVLWRSATGALCANDARCPHQWSHLGAEGAVDGEVLVCTSHFWRFDANGSGCTIDAAGRSQTVRGVATYPVAERADGAIEVTLEPVAPPGWG